MLKFTPIPRRNGNGQTRWPGVATRKQITGFWAWWAFFWVLSGCAVSPEPPAPLDAPPGLVIHAGGLLERHPWIEHEIRQFLDQEEVRAGLGFDPLSYENPFTLTLLEQRLSDTGIIRMFGTTANRHVYVRAGLFADTPSARNDIDPAMDPDTVRNHRMCRMLAADPEMLALYRNLLICHEIAHVGEWYALRQRQAVVTYTGHGISNRAEIRILTRLLHAGKVRPAVYGKLFLFYATFMNQDAESEDDINRYYRQALFAYRILARAGYTGNGAAD